MTELPLLSLLILLPVFGAVLCVLTPARYIGRIMFAVLGFESLLSLLVLMLFDKTSVEPFQLLETYSWIASLNVRIALGVDGISVLFLPTSTLMLATVYGLTRARFPDSRYAALLLLLLAATHGIFTALDSILFFLCWEMTLPPLFFLISRYGGGEERQVAAMKYTLYMLAGGALILFAFILAAMGYADQMGQDLPQGLSFNLPELMQNPVTLEVQRVVFWLLLLGFATKIPLVPLHTWLPKAAHDGPAQITALLLGLKLGVYGLLRFLPALVPDALLEYQRLLAIAGALSLVYGAVIALQQTNLRGLLAYSGLSHVGLVVMGIASLNAAGMQGAVLQLFNFTLIAFSMMMLAFLLQVRRGSTELLSLGGIATVMPRFSALLVFFMLAAIGAPLTSGFPAELLLLNGNFRAHPGLGATALFGAILAAAAMLNWIRRALWGEMNAGSTAHLQDLLPVEFRIMLLYAVLVLVLGLYPSAIVDFPAASALLQSLN